MDIMDGLAIYKRKMCRQKPPSSRSRWRKTLGKHMSRVYPGIRIQKAMRRSILMEVDDLGCTPEVRERFRAQCSWALAVMGAGCFLPGLPEAIGQVLADGAP